MKQCPFCTKYIQDAAIICKLCGRDTRTRTTLPHSPAQAPRSMKVASLVIILVVLGAGGWFFYGNGRDRRNQQAVFEAVTQYNIAKRRHVLIDVCVHAGLVSAAYEKARDHANHAMWKAREAEDCTAAGRAPTVGQ